jgi:putative sugar O-methyltransferase
MEIVVTQEQAARLVSFRNSSEAKLADRRVSYSPYWAHHAGLLSVRSTEKPGSADMAALSLRGDSGFYIPPKNSAASRFKQSSASALPRRIYREITRRAQSGRRIRLLNYSSAFNAVMSSAPLSVAESALGRIQHALLLGKPGVVGSATEVKRDFLGWSGRLPSDLIYLNYYYSNLLAGLVPTGVIGTVLEVGGGNGNLASILLHQKPTIKVILVDLPETLEVAFAYLSHLFPRHRILLPNEVTGVIPATYDVVLLTPDQTEVILDGSIDLAVNTDSFQEMTHAQISKYFDLFDRATHEGSWVFVKNRVEKVPVEGALGEPLIEIPPNRFSEFPWRSHWRDHAYEVCRIDRLVQLDDAFVRLCRVESKI